jgi:carboxylesterase type B
MKSLVFALSILFLPVTLSAPTTSPRAVFPTVKISSGTVIGSSLLGIDSFRGIPYAQPPTGTLRLKPPKALTAPLGTFTAIDLPQGCPQQLGETFTDNLPADAVAALINTPLVQRIANFGEDCLTINVQRPSTATSTSKLPVIFWIFGGGFEFGSTTTYDGSALILTSVAQGKPVIYVSVNYRVGGFGFLPGAAILADGSANLGLLDQRLGLQWVADNIAAFGGDPDKVTIWGESAGSISVFDQMALYDGDNTYNGKSLFRAGIMDSGSIVPADPVDCPKGEAVYSTVVKNAGCSSAADTLACLRGVSYETFLNAVNSVPSILSYSSVALSYLPRPDGTALTQSPDVLARGGKYAAVPFIIGDQEDEGTILSLFQFNITTTAELEDYFSTLYFHHATKEEIHDFIALYPEDPSAGSPFRTGSLNAVYPQYKRIAAIIGDLTFTLTRRVWLSVASSVKPSVPSWSYLSSYLYGVPVLGTFHGSDVLTTYGLTPGVPSSTIQAYYISFINTLDPNDGTKGLPTWPKWSAGKQLLNLNALSNTFIPDSFRSDAYDWISAHVTSFYI